MNYWWLGSGGLGLLTALLHLIGGQVDVIRPFRSCEMNALAGSTLHACWHMVTVILFGSSALLLYAAANPDLPGASELGLFIGVQFVIFAIVFLVFAIAGNSGNLVNRLIRLPHWMLLLPIGILSLLGSLAA